MAGKGGKRRGAGRKAGVPNKVAAEQRKAISDLAREYTQEAIETLVDVMRKDESGMARVKAVEALLNRGYGLPMQPFGGEDGGPIEIKIVKFAESAAKKPGGDDDD